MHKKNYKNLIIVFYVLLVLALAGMGYLYYKTTVSEQIICIQDTDVNADYDADIVMTLVPAKEWKEGVSSKARQYDVTLYNKSGYDLTNWEAVIELPGDSYVSDCWSLSYEMAGNNMIINCVDYNSTIFTYKPETFGFIIIGRDVDLPGDISIQATPIYHITDFPLFWVLLTFIFLLLLFLLICIIIEVKQRRFNRQYAELNDIINQSLKTFVSFIDAKDSYTRGHSGRVAYYSRLLAEKMGMSEQEVQNVYYVALLHDVGKISIPDSILGKRGPLTAAERAIIETHPQKGANLFKDFTAIPNITDGMLYHHERYNGRGYPLCLKGEDIPLVARIIAVADAYDAMSSDRCYRPRLPLDKIIEEFENNKGEQFDPDIAEIMLTLLRSNAEFYTTFVE